MIFKQSYRKIELTENYSLQELCDKMNRNANTNLLSTLRNDRIIVTKKHFSNFYPFNVAHLGSLMIHAKSKKIDKESESLEFDIEMKDLNKFSTYVSLTILVGIIIISILSLQIGLAVAILMFTAILIFWSRFIHNYGIDNFTKNWDKFISHKV